MALDEIMCELAQYIRIQEEAAAMVEGLKDQLKQAMLEAGTDTITGTEHKASYKAVTSSRIDTTALRKDMPELAQKYTKTTESKRFLFA